MIGRRTFLWGAGALAARAGANDRIRTAVIGMGGRGRDHMNVLARVEGVEVAAFCDPDERRMAAMAAEFVAHGGKQPRLETDLRRILDDKNIDAVTVASCNHWHALTAIWGCQAGKHVYVEKPVAHDMVEGRMMVEASRRYNRMVQGGTQRRSNARLRAAIRALHEGVVGDVYMARCIHFQERQSLGFKDLEPPPSSLHWDLWLGPARQQPFHRNLAPYNWHWFWDFGNGELGNNGVHFLDVARWGLRKGLPVKIRATGGRYGYKDQGQTPNTLLASYQFQDGAELVCEIRGRYSNPEESALSSGVFFYGSKGYMAVSPGTEGARVYLGGSKQADPDFAKAQQEAGRGNQDLSHFQSFFDAIRTGRREAMGVDISETYLSTAYCLLANISYRLGRELTWDDARLRFASDPEADRMLAGEHRKPFALPAKV